MYLGLFSVFHRTEGTVWHLGPGVGLGSLGRREFQGRFMVAGIMTGVLGGSWDLVRLEVP